MRVITVHGIRAQNKWWEDIQSLELTTQERIKIDPFDFGYFGFLKFIRDSQREKIVDEFCDFYSSNFTDSTIKPSVIAHSFGTFVVYQAMKRYNSIKFDNVIFCGSILHSNTNFRELLKNKQFSHLINDFGEREWFLRFTRCLSNQCGKGGNIGFKNIPRIHMKQISNRQKYSRHSDYFLPIQMKENWIKPIISSRKINDYNRSILRPEVVSRIYHKSYQCDTEFEINDIGFFARIDKDGNYFAKYHAKGINNTSQDIDKFKFTTAADGMHDVDSMNFKIYDEKSELLSYAIIGDHNHLKQIEITLTNPIKPKQHIENRVYFAWYNTINLKNGDTDHWNIEGIKNVNIQLNVPNKFKAVRIYLVKEYEIVHKVYPTHNYEADNTSTYTLQYVNDDDVDGLIFYFEGIENEQKRSKTYKPYRQQKISFSKKSQLIIQPAKKEDIPNIYRLELDIEKSNAASEDVLKKRLLMFKDGFLVIKNKRKNEIVGYIESTIWNDKDFLTFNEISNFPISYNVRGSSMYIIFLAIHPRYRKKGLAKRLMKEIEKVAKNYGVGKISLVAKDDLIEMYKKFGYNEIKELPEFLPGREYKSVKMEKSV